VTCWPTSGGVMGAPVAYTPTVTMAGAQTMSIAMPDSPDEACYRISIGAGATAEILIGDTDCMVRSLGGDGNSSGSITLADVVAVKTYADQPVTSTNARFDYNLDGAIDMADVDLARARTGKQALCP
jgi:hypothetical protein